ncbi:MAG: Signal recognition particle receptor FtsY [Candidatus Bipolaricaulis sibiricus]|uniref:Signal recognition particle receptor FtsY n=1 Tax=Bipolaricaulis sibiricus TaxID=2501609 RepID=A0A410FUU0_BIPS1|nr:MAG: Signal recognition particle receptor FtsY [Candidatus Bipolaricaulis sibiricus]
MPDERTTIWDRLRRGLARTRDGLLGPLQAAQGGAGPELLDRVEEVLLSADVGPDDTTAIMTQLQAAVSSRAADWDTVKDALEGALRTVLRDAERNVTLSGPRPTTLMFVGVNGSGKTTTVAKVARRLARDGARPLLVAADTFRAAAIDQLVRLGEEVGVEVLAQRPGSDPGAVVHDALEHARTAGYDVVLIDTAGRLQTKRPLMEELGKVRRVAERLLGRPPDERVLVVDATVGQNAISQAALFHEAVGLTGLAVTKLDGTARGGAVIPIARSLALPILWIGVGEGLDDLEAFRTEEFVRALIRG